MKNIVLDVRQVKKSYQDGEENRVILDDLNLQVKSGEFVAIMGPSGSGKSTLLSIIGALLSPDEGSVIIDGKRIDKADKKAWTASRRSDIGFIFQNHQLFSYLTVEDQLKLVSSLTGKKQQTLEEDLLSELGLLHKRKKFPSQLSGGERQRVAIARAFMNDPAIILADEPTASLDHERGCQVVQLIAQEVKKRGKAAIMVTHDERVLPYVDTIYRLEDHKLKKVEDEVACNA